MGTCPIESLSYRSCKHPELASFILTSICELSEQLLIISFYLIFFSSIDLTLDLDALLTPYGERKKCWTQYISIRETSHSVNNRLGISSTSDIQREILLIFGQKYI